MKKGIIIAGAILVGSVIGSFALSGGIKLVADKLIYQENTTTMISEDRAVAIALEHAGVVEGDITSITPSLTNKNGVQSYTVQLEVNDQGYTYGIDATSGEIVEYNIALATVSSTQYTMDENGYITEASAKEIALSHAGLAETDVTFVYAKLDYDDGVAEYEVEFWHGTNQYDYEINAMTGAIIGFDYEMEHIGNNTNYDTTTFITQDQAKEIALAHAELVESDVTFVYAKLDYDNGVAEYEVEFWSENTEYDYEINAVTGVIISYDFEIENGTSNIPSTTTPSTVTPSTTTYITEAKAKEIALAHAGLTESQVTFVEVHMEYDNGVAEYEVEFWSGNTEYDYEINATTGTIISYDYDIENYTLPSNNTTVTTTPSTSTSTTASITADKAKEIALSHAGVSSADAGYIKCELDYDDGRLEYEVDWQIGRTEYEYTIDANTGTILEYDIDTD